VEGANRYQRKRGMLFMVETAKEQETRGIDGIPMLISFLVGAAIGVGIVLFAESKAAHNDEKDYGDADLFV
jgi:phosphate/sulfate permease